MKPKLLDLFCCAGGASMGYNRAGFEVTGVDIVPQKNYPFRFVQADALEYVAQHGWKYDAITASPPCQRYSRETPIAYRDSHPDLIAPTRYMLKMIGVPYIIENVPDAAKMLVNPVMLCGSMFGLNIRRHRYFECSWSMFFSPASCRHTPKTVYISGSTRPKEGKRYEFSVQECRDASGCHWMTRKELDECIPPAYTEWLGKHLMAVILNKTEVPQPEFSLISLIS
jgi:DNA (cytosine-5)-methyltransferase 1